MHFLNMQVGGLLSMFHSQSSCLSHSLFHRFPSLIVQQSSNVHKQTIYEKLNVPAKPKRPAPPYIKFLAQSRPALVREFPEAKHTEIVKIAAQKWSAIDSKEKEKFTQLYKEECIDYNKILHQYENSLTSDQKAEIKRAHQHSLDVNEIKKTKKKAKELGRPKQPPSVFIRYLMSKSNERPKNQSNKDWVLSVSQEWKSINPDVKHKLKEERIKDYEKWEKELKAWEEKMIKEGNVDVVRTRSLLPTSSKKELKK